MDLTGDGKLDILSGCYSDHEPMAGLFWLLERADGNEVKAATQIKGSDGKPLIIPALAGAITTSICTQPHATDWDGDGDLDLVSGNFAGTFWLFTNEGTKEKAVWQPKPTQLMAGSKPLQIAGAHSGVQLVDLDGDGDRDLLSGSSDGGAQWAENIAKGDSKTPVFAAMKSLVDGPPDAVVGDETPGEKPTSPKHPSSNTRAWAADVNGDGKLDLLLGDSCKQNSRAPGVSEAEYRKRAAAWNKAIKAVETTMRKATEANDEKGEEAASAKWNELHEHREEFVIEQSTGIVWLLLGR